MRFSALVLSVLSALALPAAAAPPATARSARSAEDHHRRARAAGVRRGDADAAARAGRERRSAEALLDLALPDGSALVSRRGARRRALALHRAAAGGRARRALPRRERRARRDAGQRAVRRQRHYRLRVQRGAGHARRGAARGPLPLLGHAGVRERAASASAFPPAPERLPVPADVTVTRAGTRRRRHRRDARRRPWRRVARPRGRASTRGGWEVSWAPRDPRRGAGRPDAGRARRDGRRCRRRRRRWLSRPQPPGARRRRAHQRAARRRPLAQRRAAGAVGGARPRAPVLEALPPSTRFDALFFDRGTKRLFPDEPAGDARGDRRARGRDGPRADAERHRPGRRRCATPGALLRREQSTFGAAHAARSCSPTARSAPPRTAPRWTARSARARPDARSSTWRSFAAAVRPVDDDPAGRDARAGPAATSRRARGGIARVLRASDVGDAVAAALADLASGRRSARRPRWWSTAPSVHVSRRAAARTRSSPASCPAPARGAAPRGRDRGLGARASGSRCPPARPRRARMAAPCRRPRPARTRSRACCVAVAAGAGRAGRPRRPRSPSRGQGLDGSAGDAQRAVARVHAARARLLPQPHGGHGGVARSDRQGAAGHRLVRGEVERATIESSTLDNADVERCLHGERVRDRGPARRPQRRAGHRHPEPGLPPADAGREGRRRSGRGGRPDRSGHRGDAPTRKPARHGALRRRYTGRGGGRGRSAGAAGGGAAAGHGGRGDERQGRGDARGACHRLPLPSCRPVATSS